MKTDDLIDALAVGLEPAKPARASLLLLAAAAVAAVVGVVVLLGVRPDLVQALGGSMVMVAKGNRSKAVTDACAQHGGFYLGSIGGPAAELAANCIKSVELLEYPESVHAFFNDARPEVFQPQNAELAWARTLAFLRACS